MSAVSLQDAIITALLGNAAVVALVGARIYDNAPDDTGYPRITLGPSQVVSDDADCIEAEEHFQQIDVWTQESASKRGCKEICQAVKKALHDVELPLAEGALVLIEVTDWQAVDDPNDMIAHGMVNVRALVDG